MSRGVKKYVDFHQQEPVKIGAFSGELVIPDRAICAGEAKNVLYRSDKLNPTTLEDEGWIDYIHDHGKGVHVYRTDRAAATSAGIAVLRRSVPTWLRSVDELVWLGMCLGFEYTDHDGNTVTAKGKEPLPELSTTTNGKALLVIQGKRHLLAMIWGGKLGVEPRGIVH